MLCSMVLAKVWFFFGCKVLMVSGRKLAFAGSEGDHWMLPSSTIINYATFHHNCEDIPSGSHLIQGTGAACKLRPSQKPTSPTLLHPRHPLARFSVCLFFPLSLDRRSAGCLLVWWGWDPRSLLTERRMVEEEGPRDWEPPGCPTLATPPPTRPPHGPDAASRPSCINDPEYITNKRCLKFELFWYHAFKKRA